MPRRCTVCVHPDRGAIDRTLAAEPASNRRIAAQFAVSEQAVRRHRAEHLPAALAEAADATRIADADDLLGQLQELRRRALAILDQAEGAGELRTALAAIREARSCIALLLEVEGELDRRGVTNVVIAPEWIGMRTVIVQALQPFPDAALVVAARLQEIDGGHGA